MNPEKIAKLKKFDAAEYLETAEDIALYLDIAFEENDPERIAVALGTVARAKGMTEVARNAGVTREALYKALSPKGDPKLGTLVGVFKALGLKLSVQPVNDNNSFTQERA
ncbi:MAG: addiction module antidote protein [Pseudomonadota bacterium]